MAGQGKGGGRGGSHLLPTCPFPLTTWNGGCGSLTAHHAGRGHDGVSCTGRDREIHTRPQDHQDGLIEISPRWGTEKAFRLVHGTRLTRLPCNWKRPARGGSHVREQVLSTMRAKGRKGVGCMRVSEWGPASQPVAASLR